MSENITIENLIEQVRDLIRYQGRVVYDTPIYEKFHKDITEFVFENFFDKTKHWDFIQSKLMWQSNQYMTNQEANFILTGLENIRLELLERKNGHKETFWEYIHPNIIDASQKLFIDKHYHKSVLAAYIQIEVRLKEIWKKNKPQEKELDGAKLMGAVFSNNEPCFLEFQSREDENGKNVQIGFMQIFTGVMTGIRNLPAHGNVDIPRDDAIRKLILASLLMYKVDDAIRFSGVSE